jgi:DNA-binding transcriptional LysR family regulator
VAVADELSFGRAAARLYLSQPALSRRIRALERAVGCQLLRRSTHGVEVSAAGDALLRHARPALLALHDAVAAARSAGHRAPASSGPMVAASVCSDPPAKASVASERAAAPASPAPQASVTTTGR